MSEYTRVIRGIERSADYTRAKPASRYTAYKTTAYEQAAGAARQAGNPAFNQASEGAAAWLGIARSAQIRLEGLIKELGRERRIEDQSFMKESIGQLAQWINEWEGVYTRYKEVLKPEIWEAVELALRHPAMEALEVLRGLDRRFRWFGEDNYAQSQLRESFSKTEGTGPKSSAAASIGLQQDRSRLNRLLLGAEGLLMDLKRAMSYAEQQRPVDLLRLPFAAAYPYALYYGASQAYWPLPPRGTIINKYV